MNIVRISYKPDEDGENYGWLELVIQAEGFAGAVGFWSHPDWFSDFAKHLNSFPISMPDSPEVTINATQDQLQPTIYMKLEPVDAHGHLRLVVSLSDDQGTKNRVSLTAPATYAWAQRFSQALQRLIVPPHAPVEMEID